MMLGRATTGLLLATGAAALMLPIGALGLLLAVCATAEGPPKAVAGTSENPIKMPKMKLFDICDPANDATDCGEHGFCQMDDFGEAQCVCDSEELTFLRDPRVKEKVAGNCLTKDRFKNLLQENLDFAVPTAPKEAGKREEPGASPNSWMSSLLGESEKIGEVKKGARCSDAKEFETSQAACAACRDCRTFNKCPCAHFQNEESGKYHFCFDEDAPDWAMAAEEEKAKNSDEHNKALHCGKRKSTLCDGNAVQQTMVTAETQNQAVATSGTLLGAGRSNNLQPARAALVVVGVVAMGSLALVAMVRMADDPRRSGHFPRAAMPPLPMSEEEVDKFLDSEQPGFVLLPRSESAAVA